MRAFLTGGTGFIGRRLIDELLGLGWQVTALVRTFDRARALPNGVRVVPGDVTRRGTLRAGMRGADAVFHLAALNSPGARPKDEARLGRINVDGTRAVLELAGELGIPRVVYTSTATVFANVPGRLNDECAPPHQAPFDNEYEHSKQRAHFEVARPLQAQGLPIVIVCPTTVFGPGDACTLASLLRSYARRRLPVMLGAGTAANWTYVADVARGLRLSAERGTPGQTYILAGPAMTVREFFTAAEQATGLPAPRLWMSARWAAGLANATQAARPALAAALRRWNGEARLVSGEKAGRELGWEPQPLEDALRATVAWYKAADA